jgi:hypothetical protein
VKHTHVGSVPSFVALWRHLRAIKGQRHRMVKLDPSVRVLGHGVGDVGLALTQLLVGLLVVLEIPAKKRRKSWRARVRVSNGCPARSRGLVYHKTRKERHQCARVRACNGGRGVSNVPRLPDFPRSLHFSPALQPCPKQTHTTRRWPSNRAVATHLKPSHVAWKRTKSCDRNFVMDGGAFSRKRTASMTM